MAASDEDTRCSPNAISVNGAAISVKASVDNHRARPRNDPSTPARQASPSSTAAPRTTRTQVTNTGATPSSTATLINRYGTPHSAETAPNTTHARAFISIPRRWVARSDVGTYGHASSQPRPR